MSENSTSPQPFDRMSYEVIKEDSDAIYVAKKSNLNTKRKTVGFGSPLILFAIMIPLSLLGMAVGMVAPDAQIAALLAATTLAMLGAIAAGLWMSGDLSRYREILRIRLPEKKIWYAIAPVTGILLFIGLQGFASLIQNISGQTIESSETSTSIASGDGFFGMVVLLLMAPLVVPIVEELFYRGFIFGTLERSMSSWKTGVIVGVIFSSVFFGLSHFQSTGSVTDGFILFWTGLIGFVNVVYALKSNSILTPILVHVFYNGITVVTLLMGMQ